MEGKMATPPSLAIVIASLNATTAMGLWILTKIGLVDVAAGVNMMSAILLLVYTVMTVEQNQRGSMEQIIPRGNIQFVAGSQMQRQLGQMGPQVNYGSPAMSYGWDGQQQPETVATQSQMSEGYMPQRFQVEPSYPYGDPTEEQMGSMAEGYEEDQCRYRRGRLTTHIGQNSHGI